MVVHTQCFPSVMKSPHAWYMGTPLRFWSLSVKGSAGQSAGCFSWTCHETAHVMPGIRVSSKEKNSYNSSEKKRKC